MSAFTHWLGAPADFHFLAPGWLWLLAGLPVLWGLIIWQHQSQNKAQQLVDKALLPYLLTGKKTSALTGLLLFSLIWVLLALSLAGPTWQKYPVSLTENRAPLVIALSLSQTQYANDTAPDRLTLARFKAQDLLDANATGDSALIAYAQDAFVVAPLTRDNNSLTELLQSLSPAIMPADGNNASAAIRQAQQLLDQAHQSNGLIVLITDDADADAVRQASAAHAQGHIVSVLGMGDPKKQPVTLPSGKLMHDAQGNLVLSHRHDALLARLAQAGGGHYVTTRADQSDITQLASRLTQQAGTQRHQSDIWQNMGPWLLLPLLMLVALLFRRGMILLLLLLPLTYAPTANAADWQQHWNNLWWRNDQQAAQALKNNQPERAENMAKDPRWKGAGAYQAGHYDVAADAYRQQQDATSQYNLGNALAQSGKLHDAIEAYEQSLKQQPDNDDARHNLELVKTLLEQQQNQQDGDQSSAGDDSNKERGEGQNSGEQPSQNNESTDGQSSPDQPQNGQNQANHTDKADQGDPSQSGQQTQDASAADKEQQDNNGQNQQHASDTDGDTEQQQQQQQDDFAQTMNEALEQPTQPPQAHDLGQATPSDNALPADVRQLLQSVPDDPGALLKRKFELEQLKRNQNRR